MSKRPRKGDEDRWPTPSEAFGSTLMPFAPGVGRGTHVSSHVRGEHGQGEQPAEVKQEPANRNEDEMSDVLELHDTCNYIDWSDLQVPMDSVETTVQDDTVNTEKRDDSRRCIKETVSIGTQCSVSRKRKADTDPLCEYDQTQKESICPIPTCKIPTKKLKHHCWEFHLPYIFKDRIIEENENDPDFQRLRALALETLARWIIGPTATVHDLAQFVREHKDMYPDNCMMMDRCQIQMTNLTRVMEWDTPVDGRFSMYPVNSPAVLMQWRILITLLARLSPSRRAQFRRIGSDYVRGQSTVNRVLPVNKYTFTSRNKRSYQGSRHPFTSGISRSTTETTSVQSVQTPVGTAVADARVIINRKKAKQAEITRTDTRPEEPDENNNAKATVQRISVIPKAFDSHFHLDRASILLTGSLDLTMDSWLSREVVPTPSIPVDIVGGVINYCDPVTYPALWPESQWKVAIGFHPRAAPYFTQDNFDQLEQTLQDARVAGLGEIGLDRTCKSTNWISQERVFERILTLTTPNRPIILHLRGDNKDLTGYAVYERALEILSMHCEPEQCIHLHCFHGTRNTVRKWRSKFVNTYFSFTLKVKEFNHEQREAVKLIPDHRLLLETDSPYTTTSAVTRQMSPVYLGEVALIVAGIRDQPVAEILNLTLQNGQYLYK